MAIKGKCFFIFLLFLNLNFSSCLLSHSDNNPSDSTQIINVLTQHISQLTKLNDLVNNLTELVTKLESHITTEITALKPESNKLNQNDDVVEDDSSVIDNSRIRKLGVVSSVTKHSLFWSERFQFVSAVKLDTQATSLSVLPFKDVEGLSKYVAVGDDVGSFYVFSRYGDVLLRFDTSTGSPVTSILSYLSVFRNESLVVTGHGNGVVLVHKVWEITNGDESNLIEIETVYKLVDREIGSRIVILEVHHVGRTRYIVSINGDGRIKVFKESGSVIGTIVANSRPLAFLKQKLLFLTETGAGSLDLRTMKVREAACEGLNGSYALNYVFDASDRGKAYGFTSGGELVHLLIYGDSMNFKCRVRSKKKFDVENNGLLAFEAIKGYFLVVSQEKVFVYNVSSQLYARAGLHRFVFSAGLNEIIASFLNYRSLGRLDGKSQVIPLIASDHEKLVVLSLGGGYIGMYRSNLPVTKGKSNTMLWSTPVLFFILFLIVAWHFFANKKEALTSWGPYDPLNGAPTPKGPREGAFMDLRSGGGIIGPPRRYGSPTQYKRPVANLFRPTAIDPNPRPASVDPDFRGSELKYRGSSIDPSGFSKRREGLFGNSQVVDDQGS